MLTNLLISTALATPSGPLPRLEVVGEACQAGLGDKVGVTYQTEFQSCPPGGPCSLLASDPRSAKNLWIEVEGCIGPLPGRFVKTKQTCDGKPVWRHTTRLPPGRRFDVADAQNRHGWMPGPEGDPLECHPPDPATLEHVRTTEQRAAEMQVTLTSDALTVTPTEDGYELSWNSTTSRTIPMHFTGPVGSPDLPRELDGTEALLVLEQVVRLDQVHYARSVSCQGADL